MVHRWRMKLAKPQTHRWLKVTLLMLLSAWLLSGSLPTQGQAQCQPLLPPETCQLATQLIQQLSIAIRETGFAINIPGLGDIQLRAGQVLNVLVGHQSPDYQTRAGDPPGADGVGVQTYLQRLKEIIEPRAQANDRLRPLLFVVNIIQFYAREALGHLRDALQTSNDDPARRALNRCLAFLIATRGSGEDPLSEGGARALLKELSRL